MTFSVSLMRKLDVVEPELKEVLWGILEEIELNREASVTKTEFNELKEIVRELATTTKELAEAQKRTETKVEELAEAQKRTETKVEELAEAQKKTEAAIAELTKSQKSTRSQVGGLSRSMAYALENEAFRKLPEYLKTNHQLIVKERFVRKYIDGEEINVFAKAERDGREVLVVGETVLKLDDRSKMGQLDKNVKVVEKELNLPVVPLLITHFARPEILRKANEQGILVIQSFEWG